jgi:hypothetical protein
VLGAQRGLALVETLPGIDAVVVDAQGALRASSGLAPAAPATTNAPVPHTPPRTRGNEPRHPPTAPGETHARSPPAAPALAWLAKAAATTLALAALTALVSCSGSGTSSSGDGVIVNGEVPLAYVKRSTSVRLNPTSAAHRPRRRPDAARKSSPSATEHNLTARFTQGVGDASDPEVSYDGKRIVFSLRCPASNTATVDGTATGEKACTGRWNLWEYTVGAPARPWPAARFSG